MATPFTGYVGQVWRVAYASINWLSQQMAAANNSPALVASPVLTVYQTLRNAVDSITAFNVATALTSEIAAMQAIQILPLTLDETTAAYFNLRVSSIMSTAPAIAALVPAANPGNAAALLAQGNPAIADPGLLNFYMNWELESPPPELSLTDLPASAQAMATAWQTVANAISAVQGAAQTQAFDTATRQNLVSQQVANVVVGYMSGPIQGVPGPIVDGSGETVVDGDGYPITAGSAEDAWDALVALPAILADAAIINSAPFSSANQQSGVIRYTLINLLNQLAFLLLSLRQPSNVVTNLATIYNDENIMDFAARTTGNFENWQAIVAANGLQPPWTGPNGVPAGSQLFIPAQGASPPTPGVVQATYAANVLGTDIYVGQINGSMPPWTGDYQLVTGYSNLAISLGRRLQTTLGSLVYHNDFGSRIPPEVGNVQDSTTAGHIASFGQSALASDPRTGSVLNATATIQPGGLGLIEFNATVQPIGLGSVPTEINQVISPIV